MMSIQWFLNYDPNLIHILPSLQEANVLLLVLLPQPTRTTPAAHLEALDRGAAGCLVSLSTESKHAPPGHLTPANAAVLCVRVSSA